MDELNANDWGNEACAARPGVPTSMRWLNVRRNMYEDRLYYAEPFCSVIPLSFQILDVVTELRCSPKIALINSVPNFQTRFSAPPPGRDVGSRQFRPRLTVI